MLNYLIAPAILIGITTSSAAIAQHTATPPPTTESARPTPKASNPYAPFEFLIGDWYSTEAGNQLRQSLRWGPARAYITYSTYMKQPGKPEKLHFEGVMVWNGRSKFLDYVFAVEPGSGVQEKGTVRAEPDGSVVREVELTGPSGNVSTFRQVIRSTGPDAAVTSLMQQTAKGWVPNFPGSEEILMSRRPS